MSEAEQPTPHAPAPDSFVAAAAALSTIDEAIRAAHDTPVDGGRTGPGSPSPGTQDALAALLLLREVRRRLADWEPALIETARTAGASWADLAGPLGVASRQAAERRYLRLRPDGDRGATGDQRVKATRDRRAADRSVSAWARSNAADLRQLAGQITALDDLARQARSPIGRLAEALADDDAAGLVGPLSDAVPHLRGRYPELAARVEDVARRTDELRRASDHDRRCLG
ncbi:type III effector protein [Streptomyces somaliensis DSM 40738]|uniref:Type III effector protein n=1 Tax=Streptomyces somaliensis (strain ATCC 33201 / DSM 40738 / JCM 12659 / KCTC 9044 / NCTC 11332 / NRRL B-12077 / IP 733) TaxID=1134445 RepID=A0AA44DHF5_STRE0|nr:type III effector protein [Streptomyces somaliensis]MCQ0021643.1 type III effector protein [Streptomyces somaliensis DSM 40738]NKY16563.1 type III effector protein [Streptomyces somaliensis DSM 40738]